MASRSGSGSSTSSSFVVALILAGGTHEGGRQYDVFRTYLENGAATVRRRTFYGWFTEPLLQLAD